MKIVMVIIIIRIQASKVYIYVYIQEPSLHQMVRPELRAEPSLTMQEKSSFEKGGTLLAAPGCADTRTLPSPPGVYTEIQERCVHSYSNAKRCLDAYVLPQCELCGLQQAAEQI